MLTCKHTETYDNSIKKEYGKNLSVLFPKIFQNMRTGIIKEYLLVDVVTTV